MHNSLQRIPYFNEIKKIIINGGFDAYFVGGCVRDIILGRPVHDVDMVCFSHEYKEFAKAVKDGLPSVWVEFKDNIRLVRGRVEIDISKPRGADLDEDLSKRDFTINNLAMNTAGQIFGDMADIEAKIVRHVSDDTFRDDPLRILRTFRFHAQVGFAIAPETIKKITDERELIRKPASERIFAELDKLFSGKYAYDTLLEMIDTGVYEILTDGLEPDCTDEEAAKSGRGFVFFASSLFRKLDDAGISSIAKRLNFPNAMKKRGVRTADFSKKIIEILKSDDMFALRKLIYAYPDEMDDGLKLFEIKAMCDGVDEYSVEESVDRVMTELIHVNFEMPDKLNGLILQEIGIAPGPKMGEIIKTVKPLMASGELKDLDAAVEYIHKNY